MTPKVSFGKTREVDGVWVSYGEGDVHCYRDQSSKSLVIGHNKTHNIKFTDPAIVLNEDGKIYLQRTSKEGEAEHIEIHPGLFAEKLSDFIEQFVD